MGHVNVTVDDMEPLLKQAIAEYMPDLADVVNFVLGAAQPELARVKHTLDLVLDLEAQRAIADEYRAFEKSID